MNKPYEKPEVNIIDFKLEELLMTGGDIDDSLDGTISTGEW